MLRCLWSCPTCFLKFLITFALDTTPFGFFAFWSLWIEITSFAIVSSKEFFVFSTEFWSMIFVAHQHTILLAFSSLFVLAFHPAILDRDVVRFDAYWPVVSTITAINCDTFWITNSFPPFTIFTFQTAFTINDLVTIITFQVAVFLFAVPLTIID